ncbi:MAG: response regulator transcription factor [Chloroflexi bacterium]|nr:response regulator transcription factor [Chloroflexota bacterium]
MKARPLRVLLVDDQVLFRKGLRSILSDWLEVQVVGEASDGSEAIAQAAALRPDIILMDVNMPTMNGIEAARRLRRRSPEVRLIMLTISEQDEHLFDAIKAGADGYLLKDLRPEVLREMLLAVTRGEAPLSPLMAKKILAEFSRQAPLVPAPKPTEDLTSREREVLRLVAEGADNRTIADRLCLAPGTAKRHIHNILSKLQARSRSEAVAFARHHGILSQEPTQ